jgi:hypothetical protein
MLTLYDHANQNDNECSSHRTNGNNIYKNVIVGRYGGCFTEKRDLYVGEQKKVLSRNLDVPVSNAPFSRGEKRQCTMPKRLAKRCIGGSALKTATHKSKHFTNTS